MLLSGYKGKIPSIFIPQSLKKQEHIKTISNHVVQHPNWASPAEF